MINKNKNLTDIKPVFLLPSIIGGPYWQPILTEYSKLFPNTILITGNFPGFLKSFENGFRYILTKKPQFIKLPFNVKGYYPVGIVWMPIYDLLKLLYTIKPNLIWSANFSIWTFVAIMYGKLTRAKIIMIFDGISPSVTKTNSKINTYWRKILAKFCDGFITNTHETKKYLIRHLNIPKQKIFVHPYQVPHKFLTPKGINSKKTTDLIKFITLGQIIRRKGLFELLKAAEVLKDSQLSNKWEIHVFGKGDCKDELIKVIKNMNLQQNVYVHEFVAYEKVGEVLASGDVFVFPTLEDVWGVTPLEAMVLSKPVVCSKYAGMKEIIEDGVEGYIVDPLNVKEFAEKMEIFI